MKLLIKRSVLLFLFCVVLSSAVTVLGVYKFGSYIEFAEIADPGAAASGYGRVYMDSGTGKLACLDDADADCMPASGGVGGGGPKDLLLGATFIPDSTGNAFFEPYTVKATNDLWSYQVLVFNDSGADACTYFSYTAPNASDKDIKIAWTATTTTGDIRFTLDYRVVSGDDTTSLDQATAQESLAVVDTAPSAVNERMLAQLTMTETIAAGDTIQNKLCRTSGNGSDTMAAAAVVHAIYLEN